MDAKRADARELMRLIAKVEECMNHMASLIKEVEILTGCILDVEATNSSKSKDSTNLVVTIEIIKFFRAKYGNKQQVNDSMSDVMLDDLLQKKFNE
nr:hypothetical protein [Tanacetum cinerariifolium]